MEWNVSNLMRMQVSNKIKPTMLQAISSNRKKQPSIIFICRGSLSY